MKNQNLKLILGLKAKGIDIDEINKNKMKKVYGEFISFWIFDSVILKMPNGIFNILKKCKNNLKL